MSAKKILIGVMAGITTGTILGIMLKSKKSEAVRKKLLTDGKQYSEIVKEKFNKSLSGILNSIDKLSKGIDQPSPEENSQVVKKEETKKSK
jgi:gas vesicle protein